MISNFKIYREQKPCLVKKEDPSLILTRRAARVSRRANGKYYHVQKNEKEKVL